MTGTTLEIQRGSFDEQGNVVIHRIMRTTNAEGLVFESNPHTCTVRPGDDLSAVPEGPGKEICQKLHTAERIAARKASDERALAALQARLAPKGEEP